MIKASDLSNIAREAYDLGAGAPEQNPRLAQVRANLPLEVAWDIGRWMFTTGRSRPVDVHKTRGTTYNVNDMLVLWRSSGVLERLT
ncbi:hypothetical protein [Microvirga tunisiensis]|uniref:Uncharacterized protein n=1 Tax=Microvirga tunisiensis TaxID=2108360 RepID=A0A5N7MQ76_9HYPH|nr:hypothetical protein [Microvirga tunisiensis]MPR09231.1 hypothetical protein [Microvirga tunisiensis]MPR28800.1 hypothetical protein [Microvirga tunisiensis]